MNLPLSPEKNVPYPLAKHYGEYPPKNLTPNSCKTKTLPLTSTAHPSGRRQTNSNLHGCTPLARCGALTPGNWGRPPCHVEEQREQRTSSNMVSAKTMANGYQPSIEVKRGGKASSPTLTRYACADALTTVRLSTTNPNNPQHTPNPVNNPVDNNPSFFALFF